MGGTVETPSFLIRCRGTGARPPQYLTEFVAGEQPPQLDAMTIQAYYTWRLAHASGMRLAITKDNADVVLSAQSVA
jgi:histidine phosphotransferase ChpT